MYEKYIVLNDIINFPWATLLQTDYNDFRNDWLHTK